MPMGSDGLTKGYLFVELETLEQAEAVLRLPTDTVSTSSTFCMPLDLQTLNDLPIWRKSFGSQRWHHSRSTNIFVPGSLIQLLGNNLLPCMPTPSLSVG